MAKQDQLYEEAVSLPAAICTGLVLTAVGAVIRDDLLSSSAWTPEQTRQAIVSVVLTIVMTVVFLGVAVWSKRAARKLQSQIDALRE